MEFLCPGLQPKYTICENPGVAHEDTHKFDLYKNILTSANNEYSVTIIANALDKQQFSDFNHNLRLQSRPTLMRILILFRRKP